MAFGDFGGPGQWATSVISSKKAQKGWITRGGSMHIYIYIWIYSFILITFGIILVTI